MKTALSPQVGQLSSLSAHNGLNLAIAFAALEENGCRRFRGRRRDSIDGIFPAMLLDRSGQRGPASLKSDAALPIMSEMGKVAAVPKQRGGAEPF
jgi:hypothetical protein